MSFAHTGELAAELEGATAAELALAVSAADAYFAEVGFTAIECATAHWRREGDYEMTEREFEAAHHWDEVQHVAGERCWPGRRLTHGPINLKR